MKLVFVWLRFFCLVCLLSGELIVVKNVLAQEKQPDLVENLDNASRICTQDLPTAIENIINRPQFARSRWGIEVQTLSGESLYSLNADKFFTPASSAKLLVSAAALLELGANYRIKTSIYSVGNAPTLTSLRIKGKGDATITTQSLKNIVQQLQARGIKRIENLIIDDSYFDSPTINPTWEWLDVHSYFATAVNSTILNQNTVTLTLLPQQIGQPIKYFWSDAIAANQWQVVNNAITGEADIDYNVAIDGDLGRPLLQLRGELAINEPPDLWDLAIVDPAQYFLESLRSHLIQADIIVNRGTVVDRPYHNELETESFALYSPSMQQILAEINQSSNNLYAEALGKILAKKLNAPTATEAINLSLKTIDMKQDEYILSDASGLSRQNLITPQALVKVLRRMSQTAYSEVYRQSLAVPGNSGTLKRRFADTLVEGNLWGKTGTLTGVSTLAGYLFNEQYPTIAFSIVVNNSELKTQDINKFIDKIIISLNSLKNC